MSFTRAVLAFISVVALSLVGSSTAIADAPEPEAIIVDANGDVVAAVANRQDADVVLEHAARVSPGTPLQIEYVYRAHGSIPNPPNDPYFALQWNLPRMGVPQTWADVDGSGVVVAVLDTGVNFTGTDAFCSPIVSPYDAITQTAGFADLNTTSGFGHGTHVAGTIAQCTNNGVGVAGVAPAATLMPVRVLEDDGSGVSSYLARGIDWATSKGADVINMSLGAECDGHWPLCDDLLVDAAIARASAAGVVLVASSGNSAAPFVSYPSTHPDVIAVGASDTNDNAWIKGPGAGSNQGTALDVVAPGTGILQETTEFGTYRYLAATGTSMAAPHAAAAAALILDADPSLTPGEVAELLKSTAHDVGPPGFDVATGWGRIAVDVAVAQALPPEPPLGPCKAAPCDTVASVDSGGQWGVWGALHESAPVNRFYFGDPGDVPFMGDWDGNGVSTPGLYRQSDGFVYLRNSNTEGTAELEFLFGDPGDVPLVGDFDGDGRDTVSIWRPSEARVFIINELGEGGEGLGAAEFDFYFGNSGDIPFIGDFDGDGIDTIGLRRESTGFVYLTNKLSTGVAEIEFYFGDPGDKVLAGDWDGDGDDTVAVYRPSNGTAYMNLENTNGAADWEVHVGAFPWVVTAGHRS